jgi:hypothetical protein
VSLFDFLEAGGGPSTGSANAILRQIFWRRYGGEKRTKFTNLACGFCYSTRFASGSDAVDNVTYLVTVVYLRRLRNGRTCCMLLISVLLLSQVVRRLGGALPVLVDGEDWEATAEELDDIFLGDAGEAPEPTPPPPSPLYSLR